MPVMLRRARRREGLAQQRCWQVEQAVHRHSVQRNDGPWGMPPGDKSPLLGYQLKISPIGVTMGCRPRIWSPPPLQTATENCDRPKRWDSYEDKGGIRP